MVWYTNEILDDEFKQVWKMRIKRRKHEDQWKGINNRSENATTSTFFVPPTAGSRLYMEVMKREQLLRKETNWNVKILEAPGTPLLNRLSSTFPITQGCPRGESCSLCDGSGIKCSKKGIVYEASCSECELTAATYVGESSRPFRERILEHVKNAAGWNSKSFILRHWMRQHGLQTTCPKFTSKIIASYSDPLRRQLCEALHILEKGTLNSKTEFNMNEICRLQCETTQDMNTRVTREQDEEKREKCDIIQFIAVMSSLGKIANIVPDVINDQNSCFRKRTASQLNHPNKRRKKRDFPI